MRKRVVAVALFCSGAIVEAADIERPRVQSSPAREEQVTEDLVEEPDEHADIEGRRDNYVKRHTDAGILEPMRMRQLVRELYEKERAARLRQAPESIGGTNWVSVGPTNFAGRIRSISVYPASVGAGNFLAGAATGGVWKTTNNGVNWNPLTDGLANLTVGAVAIAPSSPSVIYLGTGEPVGSGIPGIGFLSSPDGGTNWNFPGAGVLSTAFWKLSVDPSNANDLLAGTIGGGYRSINAGANWTPFVVPVGTPGHITDIVRMPGSPSVVFAAAYPGSTPKMLKSIDGGSNWTDYSTGMPALSPSRISLALDSTGATLWAGFDSGGVAYVYKTSTAGAAAWTNTGVVNPSYLYFGQATYNNAIVVSPSSANTVILCGAICSRTIDGGTTWAQIPASHHVDVHALVYDSGGTLVMGNDGGIYTSADSATILTSRNNGLVVTQFYKIGQDRVNRNRVFGGLQDNGTNRRDFPGTSWSFMISSDGQDCEVHNENPEVMYGTNQPYSRGNFLWRTKDAGAAGVPLFVLLPPAFPSTEALPFDTNFVPDPHNSSTLYLSTQRVWKSVTGGDGFFPLPTTTTDGSTWNTFGIASIGVANTNSATIMVSKDTDIFRSTDAGQTWRRTINGLPSAPARYVNHVEIDPVSPLIAYAALATTTGNSVYRTADGGGTWVQRSAGLPNFAAQVVRVDPTDAVTLYCGTDVGVYRSTDSGLNWSLFGTGIPKVAVYDLQVSPDGTLLRAGTHGRGVWELQIPASTNPLPTASITSPASSSVAVGAVVSFSGTIGDDSGIATGTWHFPDTWDTVRVNAAGSTSTSHTFTRAGMWPVTLAAEDAAGGRAAAAVKITVAESGATCAAPIVFPGAAALPASMTFNTESFTDGTDAADPIASCLGRRPNSTLWVDWTAPASATYEFSTCGSTYDTALAAFTNVCGGTLIPVACSDDIDPNGTSGCPNGGSRFSIAATAGTVYHLMIGGKYFFTSKGPLNLTVVPSGSTAPTVTRIAAQAGPTSGGMPVTIYGSNFVAGATLTIGGTAATNVNVLTSTILTAVTPAHAAGMVDVIVTNPDTQNGRILSGYTYVACSYTRTPSSASLTSAAQSGSFAVTASGSCGWFAISDSAWISTLSSGGGGGNVAFTVAANTAATPRTGTISVGGMAFTITQDGNAPPVPPSSLVATAVSGTSVSLTWSSPATDHFEVWRNSGAGFTLIASPATTSYTDNAVTAGNAYVYRVRGVSSGAVMTAFSNDDLATTIMFTNDPLVVSTLIKEVHVTQLRQAANAVRATAGLTAVTFTDDPLMGVVVKALHLSEIRSAMNTALTALSVPAAGATPATGDVIRAVDVTNLRTAVK